MSVETFYLSRNSETRAGLRELDRETLTAAVTTDDGDVVDAGRTGTIVGVWREGAAFEVEFAHPVGALATVEGLCKRRTAGVLGSGPSGRSMLR